MKCPCCKYQETEDVFDKVQIVEHVELEEHGWTGPVLRLDVNYTYLSICPKCGVAFKEV